MESASWAGRRVRIRPPGNAAPHVQHMSWPILALPSFLLSRGSVLCHIAVAVDGRPPVGSTAVVARVHVWFFRSRRR